MSGPLDPAGKEMLKMIGKTWIIYHRDADGFMSGYLAHKKLVESGRRDIRMHSIQYREALPEIRYDMDEVYMLDYSLPDKEMADLAAKLENRLVWIDHHETSLNVEAKMKLEWVRGVRISSDENKVAACELCWDLFWSDKKVPECVTLIGDWDTFRWESMPDGSDGKKFARFFAQFIDGLGLDPKDEEERDLLERSLEEPASLDHVGIKIGKRLCEKQDTLHAEIMENCSLTTVMTVPASDEQLTALVVNHRGNSLMFQSKIEPRHEILISYRLRGKDDVEASLYGVSDDVHCGKIARSVSGGKGGGHKGAAGFVMPLDEFRTRIGMDE